MLPHIPPDDQRCEFTFADGRRCRAFRVKGADTTLCYFHFNRSLSLTIEPHPGFVAAEILPPDQALDSAQAVNAALTRMFRCVAEGRLSRGDATIMAYIAQTVVATLPQMQREAAAEPAHPLLGADPEAIVAELAQTLQKSIRTGSKADSSGANGEGSTRSTAEWRDKPAATEAMPAAEPEEKKEE